VRLIRAEEKTTQMCLQIELAEEKSQSVHSQKSPRRAQQMYVTKEKSHYSECYKKCLEAGWKSARNCDKLRPKRRAWPANPGPTYNTALLPLTSYRVITLALFFSARKQPPFQHLQRKLQNIGTKERNHRIAPVCLDQLCPTACGPVQAFVRPSLVFSCSESTLHTDNQSLFW